jgi:deoxyribodipyrimidine photo-lyase
MQKTIIHWFRNDLRLADNPALFAASQVGEIVPIYIFDDEELGAASKWWLHYALEDLNRSLNGNLLIYKGNALEILQNLTAQYQAQAIYWNRCYEPQNIARDKIIKEYFKNKTIECNSFNGALLWEPWEILKSDGSPYKVFTPYYRNGCLQAKKPREAKQKIAIKTVTCNPKPIASLNLLPQIRWDKQLEEHWNISEEGAQAALNGFIRNKINNYKNGRDYPSLNSTSKLSPYLHFGQISPNQVWYAAHLQGNNNNIDSFCSELGWREFSYYLLYHFPELPNKNWQAKFDNFPWINDEKNLKAWQKGQTGYPIIDAGMRELWQTGSMHNRVRMIVGSFLVKNLLIDWRKGAAWFFDCLTDADLASNSASWQWVAGCGADAAPYFRIFNPITQGKKFDANGEYTKKFIPELARLPDKYLFEPWLAPKNILDYAGVKLDENYPLPIVDIAQSRDRALAAFKSLKNFPQKSRS